MSRDHEEEIALIVHNQAGEVASNEPSDCVPNDQTLETIECPSAIQRQATINNNTLAEAPAESNTDVLLLEDNDTTRRNIINDVRKLTRTGVHEQAIDTAGFGEFQWRFFVVLAMALMADGSEVAKMSNVLDEADKAFCLSRAMKTSLGGSSMCLYVAQDLSRISQYNSVLHNDMSSLGGPRLLGRHNDHRSHQPYLHYTDTSMLKAYLVIRPFRVNQNCPTLTATHSSFNLDVGLHDLFYWYVSMSLNNGK